MSIIDSLGAVFKSASKIVLLMVSAALIVGLFSGHVSEETFKTGLLMVFTYYFAKQGNMGDVPGK